MKIVLISAVSAFNPFILGNGENCLDECGGVGGKCESVCGTKGYCCNPSNGFGDCVEMIHYGMMIQKDYTDEFQCVQYKLYLHYANYSYTCDHPDYTLVELKSGILCLRAFEQLVTFNEATNICHFDARSRLVGPGDEEDAKLMTSMINHRPLWLPPRNIDGQWRDYQTQYQSTFLNFAPREPDGGDHDHLQLNAFGRVQDEPGTTEAFFICGRDPYFTYSPRADYDYNNASDYGTTDGFVSGRIRPIGDYDEVAVYEDTSTDDSNYIDMSQYHQAMADFGMEQPYDYRGRR